MTFEYEIGQKVFVVDRYRCATLDRIYVSRISKEEYADREMTIKTRQIIGGVPVYEVEEAKSYFEEGYFYIRKFVVDKDDIDTSLCYYYQKEEQVTKTTSCEECGGEGKLELANGRKIRCDICNGRGKTSYKEMESVEKCIRPSYVVYEKGKYFALEIDSEIYYEYGEECSQVVETKIEIEVLYSKQS